MIRLLIRLGLLALLILSYWLVYRNGTQRGRQLVLVANGESVSRARLDQVLVNYRDQALTELATQVVVEQAARRRGLAVDDEDFELPSDLDPELRAATLARLRNGTLLRKLVLDSLKPDQKASVVSQFGSELTGYRLSYLLLLPGISQSQFLTDLRAGMPYEALSLKYARHNPPELTPEWLGVLLPEDLLKRFGPSASEQIQQIKVGQWAGPFECGLGNVVVRVNARLDRPEDLQAAADSVLFAAHKNSYLRKLGAESSMQTPLKWSALDRVPLNIQGATPARLARPGRSTLKVAAPMPPVSRRRFSQPLPLAIYKPVKLTQPEICKGPLRANVQSVKHRLIPHRWDGRPVLCLDLNDNHHCESSEPLLVHIGLDGWELVGELSDSLDRIKFSKDYGWWTDDSVAHWEGPLWNRKRVVDAAPNGMVEASEVTLKEFRRSTQFGQANRWELGVEVVRDPNGWLTACEQTANFGRLEASRQDIELLEIYAQVDGNWQVASH